MAHVSLKRNWVYAPAPIFQIYNRNIQYLENSVCPHVFLHHGSYATYIIVYHPLQ